MNPQLKALQQLFGRHAAFLQGVAAPLLVVAILAMMVLPMPATARSIVFLLAMAPP